MGCFALWAYSQLGLSKTFRFSNEIQISSLLIHTIKLVSQTDLSTCYAVLYQNTLDQIVKISNRSGEDTVSCNITVYTRNTFSYSS